MKVVLVANPAAVPVRNWVWCWNTTPDEAAAHVAKKYNIPLSDTVYTFGNAVAVPITVTSQEFWKVDNDC